MARPVILLHTILKSLHLATVTLTALLFLLRGIWFFSDSPLGRARWVRVVPHVNDTLLLLSGVGLVLLTRQFPHEQLWLAAKLAGMLLYILLGMAAFRFARMRRTRILAWLLAMLVFAAIVATALTRGAILPF